jgi:hypothetical protein
MGCAACALNRAAAEAFAITAGAAPINAPAFKTSRRKYVRVESFSHIELFL